MSSLSPSRAGPRIARCRRLAATLAAAWALPGLLLPLAEAAHAAPDPADAKAAVSAQTYRSALSSYQPLQDPPPPVADWRAANRRVHEAGGWRAYLREAQQPGGSTAVPTAPAAVASRPAARDAGAHQH